MTIYELHLNFSQQLDKQGSQSYQSFKTYEIDTLLNRAVQNFVETRYGKNNIKKEGLQETEKRTDDLRVVEKIVNILPDSDGEYLDINVKTKYYILPNDYWFAIDIQVLNTVPNCPQTYTLVKPMRENDKSRIFDDPFHMPKNKERIYCTTIGQKLQVYYDPTTTIGNLKLAYIFQFPRLKQVTDSTILPQTFDGRYNSSNINTEYFMPPHTHQEIVDIAVALTLETVESPRQQTAEALLSKQE